VTEHHASFTPREANVFRLLMAAFLLGAAGLLVSMLGVRFGWWSLDGGFVLAIVGAVLFGGACIGAEVLVRRVRERGREARP
jgi:hypothetical protein